MPVAMVRGVGITYAVLGQNGPWIVLTGGGRMDLDVFRPLGEHLAQAGYRVLIHDRRNCGASDVVIAGDDPEEEIFADDTHQLLAQLGALPVVACGGAAGARLSLLLAARHPGSVRGLLLWWPTGGRHACERLAQDYYGQFIDAAQAGGMEAVCTTPYFSERIERNPGNRQRLLSMDAADFIATMGRWRQFFLDSSDLPVIGLTEAALRAITVPACVVPGHDAIHPREVGESLSRLLPRAELLVEPASLQQPQSATVSRSERQRPLADLFLSFLRGQGLSDR
jgi:pimeloyl-ACP methyl ester carboxylesterase